MKLICELNDEILLGRPGNSSAAPRVAARAIIQNADGLYAVMLLQKFGLYSLPGSGIEEGEDILDALRREIFEEVGCTCDKIEELGTVYENRACHNFTQMNHYFSVQTHHIAANHLTDKERGNNATLLWLTWEELSDRITHTAYTTEQQKYIQARDTAALGAYERMNRHEHAVDPKNGGLSQGLL